MNFKDKVSLPKYFSGLILTLGTGGWYWYGTGYSLIWFAILMLATVLNHYMMVKGLSAMTPAQEGLKPSISKILLYLFGKTLLLAAAIVLVIRFASGNIYIALGLYIFQLLILLISIKKDS